jgi:hypothetical protein
MPIYIEISRLHGSVTIVPRGKINPDEIRGAAQQIFDARVPEFAKMVDVSAATTDVNEQQIASMAALLRGPLDQKRGPVAFLIDPARGECPGFQGASRRGLRAQRRGRDLPRQHQGLADRHRAGRSCRRGPGDLARADGAGGPPQVHRDRSQARHRPAASAVRRGGGSGLRPGGRAVTPWPPLHAGRLAARICPRLVTAAPQVVSLFGASVPAS